MPQKNYELNKLQDLLDKKRFRKSSYDVAQLAPEQKLENSKNTKNGQQLNLLSSKNEKEESKQSFVEQVRLPLHDLLQIIGLK